MDTHLAVDNSEQTYVDKLTSNIRLWLLGVAVLLLLGVFLLLGPKFPSGPIHIHIARGHGITTPDLFALIPIVLAVIWFFLGLWRHREAWMGSIRQYPVKAFFLALALGIFLGLLFGIPWGAIYRTEVREFMHFLSYPFR